LRKKYLGEKREKGTNKGSHKKTHLASYEKKRRGKGGFVFLGGMGLKALCNCGKVRRLIAEKGKPPNPQARLDKRSPYPFCKNSNIWEGERKTTIPEKTPRKGPTIVNRKKKKDKGVFRKGGKPEGALGESRRKKLVRPLKRKRSSFVRRCQER